MGEKHPQLQKSKEKNDKKKRSYRRNKQPMLGPYPPMANK
jgi:hypothetical protein